MTEPVSLKIVKFAKIRHVLPWFCCLCFLVISWLALRFVYGYFNEMIDRPLSVRSTFEEEQPVIDLKPQLDPTEPPKQKSIEPPKQPVAEEPKRQVIAKSQLPPKPTASLVRLAEERLLLRTVGGDITIALYSEIAPVTVKQFLTWARLGVFDTTHFSRLEPGFVLQSSLAQDRLIPFRPDQEQSLRTLPGEFSKTLKHRKGVLSMGREDGKPDSAQTSYSILLGDAPHLDGKYTIFGHVEAGMEVVERLAQMSVQPETNRPESRFTILSAQAIHQDDLSFVQLEKPVDVVLIKEQVLPRSAVAVSAAGILKSHCWKCHGDESTRGELDLTSAKTFAQGGHHGPVYLDKDVLKSPLLHRLTIESDERMPPKGARLHPEEIKMLTRWLSQGAEYPPEYVLRKQPRNTQDFAPILAKHWFFQPLKRVEPPNVQNRAWVKNGIDAFILASLESKKLHPVAMATTVVLRRRLSLDLTGLPPDAESPTSYELLVNQLLQSKHYGEQMARPWLDLVRFAESDGYEDDTNRPQAFHYRDFVIRAMNDDMPFDQFLRWQIAGDELAPNQSDARAATGFLAAGPYQTFFPKKKDRYDELDDIVSTTGVAFLGMTVGCARCHDHKHDPISQRDYYRFVSIFNGGQRQIDYLDSEAGRRYESKRAPVDLLIKEFTSLTAPAREKVRLQKIDALMIEPHEKAALKLPYDPSNSLQMSLLHRYEHLIQVSSDEARQTCDGDVEERWDALAEQIKQLEKKLSPPPDRGLIYIGSKVEPASFLERGDPNREMNKIPPGFLTALTKARPAWQSGTYLAWGQTPRSALANWLTDTNDGAGQQVARVIVNRLWQHHFGVGLVSTVNDFGVNGGAPSHPELLDWLAQELIRSGWKLKHLHRLIVQSATYQLGGKPIPELLKGDPENRLQGRRTPRRLTAEELRDSILTVSGQLNRQQFGPSIKPPIPEEAIFPTAPKHGEVWPSNVNEEPSNWRRSIYIFSKRSNPVPFLQLFDAPDAASSCAARQQTSTPTQSLALLNDHFIRVQSQLLAKKLLEQAVSKSVTTVTLAYQSILSRAPDAEELRQGLAFLKKQEPLAKKDGSLEALTDLCHALFMSNEFLFVE